MIDKVICAICNYSGKNITKHIMKKHNMNIDEYKRIYQSEIECENSKKLRANNRRNTIRKKYGVDNVSQLESIKNNIQKKY